jgi:hypothetical protein
MGTSARRPRRKLPSFHRQPRYPRICRRHRPVRRRFYWSPAPTPAKARSAPPISTAPTSPRWYRHHAVVHRSRPATGLPSPAAVGARAPARQLATTRTFARRARPAFGELRYVARSAAARPIVTFMSPARYGWWRRAGGGPVLVWIPCRPRARRDEQRARRGAARAARGRDDVSLPGRHAEPAPLILKQPPVVRRVRAARAFPRKDQQLRAQHRRLEPAAGCSR